MFKDFIYRLLNPIIKWHRRHRAEIIAEWLKENDPQVAEAVSLLRESRSARYLGSQSWEKKRARRKALRRLRVACPDPIVRTAVRKPYPPLSNTWS